MGSGDRRRGARDAGRACARAAVDLSGPAGGAAGPPVDPELVDALDVAPEPAVAAFFDVDGTLLRGASLYHLARGLYARGFFDARALVRFGRRQVVFRLRGVEDPAALQEARETALEFIRGRPVEELQRVSEEVVRAALATQLWPGTRALARMHVEEGQRVWLVTATPVEVAGTIARELGLTGALGTVAETRDGVYTGRLVGRVLHGPAKAEAVRALAEREGLDLARCAAYSDSANDLPMLELVGHPCAVNPDRRLRGVARERGWRVREYRSARRAWRLAAVTAGALGGLVVLAGAAGGAAARLRSRPSSRGR
ncbi:phosphoserine phosphatase [Motilibacter rhizosphaerae]|uniref:Phosphoserine phosphatase n=1 Tax=Motilibacter rhizosphaerae TaxID=598652 RepID=A0A4Q7NAA5_9ACTN|nr:HAD-IB family hydrolase [Motilibacter rhizosphaerae]RZS79063.1 phosphoserine phosphatase [Motilibacter rhizosphaerae]